MPGARPRNVWAPRPLCISSSKLHDFFRLSIPSSKLHEFYVDTLSNSMKPCGLSFELHDKRPKTSVLMLICTIRCVVKATGLGSFFASQWKAPQFHAMRTPSCRKTDQLRLSFRKTSSKLKSWKLSINRKIPPELNLWNAVSPGVLHQRCAKWRLLVFCPAKNHGARN